jgi:hypothetical protein
MSENEELYNHKSLENMGRGGLLQTIQFVCHKTKTEGRIIQLTNGKILVFDCPYWSTKASTLLHLYKPDAIISIEQSTASLSGFIVTMDENIKACNFYMFRIFVLFFSIFSVYGFLWVTYLYVKHSSHDHDKNHSYYWVNVFLDHFNAQCKTISGYYLSLIHNTSQMNQFNQNNTCNISVK